MHDALSHILSLFSWDECEFSFSYPLSRLTTLRIGGAATAVATPKSETALCRLLELTHKMGIPRFLIGNGSNLLASDSGYRGLVIRTCALRELSVAGGVLIAACGAGLAALSRFANNLGIGGFSALAGIPGSVGGALFMNAGAGEEQIGDRVLSVRAVPVCGTPPILLTRDECAFAYRKSIFQKRRLIVLSATFSGPVESPKLLFERTALALAHRQRTQPLEYPNAGSVFRRPQGDYAGRLIEAAGLKGACIGGVAVSEKHAGFLVNMGDATASDFRALTEHVRGVVAERFGIPLEREIEYMGEV